MSEQKRTEIEKRIDILEDDIADIDPKILKLLLKDKTTRGNILWCTKDYESYGPEYEEHQPMEVRLITGELSSVIQPRAAKSNDEAPITTEKSYSIAQDLLKNKEAQYFSRDELNKMLPQHLRKKK